VTETPTDCADLGTKQALDRVLPVVHAELRRIASAYLRRERADHTLQPTALVNEAYLRLAERGEVAWESKAHFLAIAANVMRQILVDHARARQAHKRHGDRTRVELDEALVVAFERDLDLVWLDDALDRLGALDWRLARVVELRFFGGLTTKETAEVLAISTATVEREWATARGWLRRELTRGDSA
jgi:RNA polymerase sigma-70 factor (ECF subfamily)